MSDLLENPPYYECICGIRAFPLTDDTSCECGDYYDQKWWKVEPGQRLVRWRNPETGYVEIMVESVPAAALNPKETA